MVRPEDIQQEEKELLALRQEAFDRGDKELFERYSKELCRVRRDLWESMRMEA